MKTRIKQFNAIIVCFAIMSFLWGCNPNKIEQREFTIDVILSSDLKSSSPTLPEELQSLYAPLSSLPDKDNKITIFIPTGKLSRVDLKTAAEINIIHEKSVLDKIQEQLKKPKEEDIQKSIVNYLSKVNVEILNSKEQNNKEEKINRINTFIQQQQDEDSQYAQILFFSENTQSASWDKYKKYNNIDSIREIILESVSNSPKNKFLIVYNPPLNTGNSVIVPNDSDIISNSINLNKPSLEFDKINATEQLIPKIYPENVSEKFKKVIWQSNNESVAKVDSIGVVTAIANGSALISVNTINGLSATCYVTVKGGTSPTSVTLVPTAISLKKGESKSLKETVYPKDATNKEVSWESSDEKIATVDLTGKVTAVAEKGSATITVKTQDGGKTAQCKVTIGGSSSHCTIPVPGGTYTGECKNGQPDGMGTIYYKSHTLICSSDPQKRYAEAGQYIVGQFRDGGLLQGKLFGSDGNQVEAIICGGGAH